MLIRPRRLAAALAVALSLLVVSPAARADELGLNVFGFSHHFKNPYDEPLKEFNPGLGVQWTFARSARASLECDAGVYQDSFAHANYHLSLGGRVRAGGPFEFGLHLINAMSPSLNDNHPVVTPYPFVAVRTPRATINLTYMPELKSFNGLPAMATFVTVYPWGDRAARRARDLSDEDSTRSTALEFTFEQFLALSGFNSPYGSFLWRNMFDDRRGLRLGVGLSGDVQSYTRGEAHYGPSGSFTAEVLMQYLQRQAPRGPLRSYWATGLQTRFHGGSSIDESTAAWRTDLGVEYALTPEVSMLIEYGIALQYDVQALNYTNFPESRESWRLMGTGAKVKLVTAWGGGAGAAASPATSTSAMAGPFILLGRDLRPTSVGSYNIGWRWPSSPTRAIRLVGSPALDNTRDDGSERRSYGLAARMEFIRRHPGAHKLSSYWGVGPVLSFRYTENRYEVRPDPEVDGIIPYVRPNDHSIGLAAGGTAVVGVDYALGDHLQLMAEYTADLVASWIHHDNDDHATSWRFANYDVRLGLGTAF